MHVTPILILLLQLAAVLGLCRIMGALAVRIGQPRVVGEMIAGIMLGPSLLGWLSPPAFTFLFPPSSVGLLNSLAQIGVILFLFLIGLELDPRLVRRRGRAALVISHMSIILALLSGATLTLFLYPRVFNHSAHSRFTAAALFIGAAMSVTAFPVLARILSERQMLRSNVGATAIACAAIDDVTAWCMLAFVLAVARAQGLASGLTTAALVIVYVLFMFVFVRPSLRRLQVIHEKSPAHANGVFAIVLLLVLLSSSITELVGIHALFGAFLLGAIMPRETGFVKEVARKLEDFIVTFLLPIFFAYAGLRTRIGLLDNPNLWGLTALVIFTACFAKFGGSFIAGNVVGIPLRESAAIGILMNTRGLMELVILTIGLQLGVITDAVFAMMVLMALVTTAMTSPVLNLVLPWRTLAEEGPVDEKTAREEFGVLIPIAQPETARAFARLVFLFGSGTARQTKVYGLALSRFSPHEAYSSALEESQSAPPSDALAALTDEASRLGLLTEAITFPSRDIPSDIARVARAKKADLVLMGFHKPVFGNAILGGTVHRVLTGADSDVAIFVNRGLPARPRILVPFQGSPHDHLALDLAVLLARNAMLDVTVLHVVSPASEQPHHLPLSEDLPSTIHIESQQSELPIATVLKHARGHDCLIIGLTDEWGLRSGIFGFRAERIASDWAGSLLLVRKHVPHPHLSAASSPSPLIAAAVNPLP